MKKGLHFQTYFLMLVAILLTSLMGACLSGDYSNDAQEAPEHIVEKDRLPRFNVTMNDGTNLNTDDLIGRKSVIVFFSTSCPDCRRFLPVLSVFYCDYAKTQYINVICIAREEKKADVERFWTENNLEVPYAAPENRGVYNLFAESGVPRVYIANEDGIVTKVFTDGNVPTLQQLQYYTGVDTQVML